MIVHRSFKLSKVSDENIRAILNEVNIWCYLKLETLINFYNQLIPLKTCT